jgi:hypothetical protein
MSATAEEAKTIETALEVVEGMQFDRGYLSPYFVTDPERMECLLEDPLIAANRTPGSRMVTRSSNRASAHSSANKVYRSFLEFPLGGGCCRLLPGVFHLVDDVCSVISSLRSRACSGGAGTVISRTPSLKVALA